MSEFTAVLDKISSLGGVLGAFVLDADMNVQAGSENGFSPDEIAELIKVVNREALMDADDLQLSNIERHQITFADMQILLENLTTGGFLVVCASPGVNLGKVRLEIRKNKKIFETEVG